MVESQSGLSLGVGLGMIGIGLEMVGLVFLPLLSRHFLIIFLDLDQ